MDLYQEERMAKGQWLSKWMDSCNFLPLSTNPFELCLIVAHLDELAEAQKLFLNTYSPSRRSD